MKIDYITQLFCYLIFRMLCRLSLKNFIAEKFPPVGGIHLPKYIRAVITTKAGWELKLKLTATSNNCHSARGRHQCSFFKKNGKQNFSIKLLFHFHFLIEIFHYIKESLSFINQIISTLTHLHRACLPDVWLQGWKRQKSPLMDRCLPNGFIRYEFPSFLKGFFSQAWYDGDDAIPVGCRVPSI